MSKKQASLLNFFTSSPKTSTPAKSRIKTEEVNGSQESPLRTNVQRNRENSISPVKPIGKRKRLIVSSDEEDEENQIKRVREEPKTPSSRRVDASSRKLDDSSAGIDMAESFIHSFRFEDSMNTSLNETLNTTADLNEKKDNSLENDIYLHETLDWLRPENIRDAESRKKDDQHYDPTTLLVPPDFLKTQTPGHQQWWIIKSANFDTVLLFKVGKFYELYHMDAVVAVNNLSLTYMRGSFAHAGFPEAAYGKFADQLVSRGYKVARVEQTETPQQLEERNAKKVGTKDKVVKRELCRITTAGTKTYGVMDGETREMDAESSAKYLFALKEINDGTRSTYGICFIDTSIGEFNTCQFEDDDYRSYLRTVLATYSPSQLLLERGHVSPPTMAIINTLLNSVPKEYLTPRKQFLLADATVSQLTKLKYLGSDDWPQALREMLDQNSTVPKADKNFELAWSSMGALLFYLERCLIDVDMVTMRNFVKLSSSLNEQKTSIDWNNKQMVLDGVTIYNLNLIPSTDLQASNMCLFNVINNCNTSFGRRLLRQWICSPSCDSSIIKQRQQAVEYLYTSCSCTTVVKNMTEILGELPDLERLLQKIHITGLKYRADTHPDSRAQLFEMGKYNARKIKNLALAVEGFTQCLKLFRSESQLADLKNDKQSSGSYELISKLLSPYFADKLDNALTSFKNSVNLEKALEAGKIEPNIGVDKDYDGAADYVKECLQNLETYRKEMQTQLKCQITYFGSGKLRYQMEIADSVKTAGKFEIKSKKKGYCRYYTPELEELIEQLGDAEQNKEKQIDESTRKVFEEFDRKRNLWREVVDRISTLDVILSFARYAQTSPLAVCRPEFDFDAKEPYLEIENGSHPGMVAQGGTDGAYIANDTFLGGEKAPVMLLTGPNMGGKSTLMRQVAVLTVMAHMGCLVPAKSMKLTPVDRIFTRIGANDRILCGQSTFFVEMNETQVIMRDATRNSLVLIDELGRGTSTYDGTAIASAVLKEFADRINCRTFFSTHYHTLCKTSATNRNICQAHMACMVENENEEDPTIECVTFLYKLAVGPCPKSYGFYAAKLAGINEQVIREAYSASSLIELEGSLTKEVRARLREAAAAETTIEDLRKIVESL